MVQAWHNGHQNSGFWSGMNSQSASQIPSAGQGEVPAEMDEDDIQQAIRDYADFAVRCQKGGLDGVEIHCAHGYLPQQFLSPYSNIRKDKYGGSLENRMRFSMELIDAMREAVGPEIDIAVDARRRLNIWSARRVAQKLEAFDIAWLEQPILFDNSAAMAAYAKSVRVPISTGAAAATPITPGYAGKTAISSQRRVVRLAARNSNWREPKRGSNRGMSRKTPISAITPSAQSCPIEVRE